MAVYTHLTEADITGFLAAFDIGALEKFQGVEQGVENTNYILHLIDAKKSKRKAVLTLFEKRVREADVPFYLSAMAHLSRQGAPTPSPIADRDGMSVHRLAGRPAVLTTFLIGAPHMSPSIENCAALGRTVAELHNAAGGFAQERKNDLGPEGWSALADACRADAERCAPGLTSLIDRALATVSEQWPSDLPRGLIHADLFPDNVFFDGDELCGVIDFYFACTDFFVLDLAICLNAWASENGAWNQDKAKALLLGYESVRPLASTEKNALPIMVCGAALRFLLTRLFDWINQVDGAIVTVKDPLEYARLLDHHLNSKNSLTR